MFIQITIGRNVRSALNSAHWVPMSDLDWAKFQADALQYLEELVVDLTGLDWRQLRHTDATLEKHVGDGMWSGTLEDSVKYAVYFPVSMIEISAPMTNRALIDFKHAMGELATRYSQDSIHFITGGTLIKAR